MQNTINTIVRAVWSRGLRQVWDRTRAGAQLLQRLESYLIDHNAEGV